LLASSVSEDEIPDNEAKNMLAEVERAVTKSEQIKSMGAPHEMIRLLGEYTINSTNLQKVPQRT